MTFPVSLGGIERATERRRLEKDGWGGREGVRPETSEMKESDELK